jgi:predicted acetyltransferase
MGRPGRIRRAARDPEAKGASVTLADGTVAPRLPGFRRWLWDGAFCGSIGFRWRPGTPDLPPHVLRHIGYAVVPWKRGRGCAKRALALTLTEIGATGLGYVELITDPENIASQAVILANGGQLVERFREPPAYGGEEALNSSTRCTQHPSAAYTTARARAPAPKAMLVVSGSPTPSNGTTPNIAAIVVMTIGRRRLRQA